MYCSGGARSNGFAQRLFHPAQRATNEPEQHAGHVLALSLISLNREPRRRAGQNENCWFSSNPPRSSSGHSLRPSSGGAQESGHLQTERRQAQGLRVWRSEKPKRVRPSVGLTTSEKEPAHSVVRLVEITSRQRQTPRTLLDRLRAEYGIEKPSSEA